MSSIGLGFRVRLPISAVSWRAYQRRAPTTAEVVGWWMRYPNAGMGLVRGSDAGLIVLEAAP